MSAQPAPPRDRLRLGGMALGNGLLVHGPTSWAAAIRAHDGSIQVASGPKPRAPSSVDRVPGARGVVRLGEAMVVIPLVKRALPQVRLPFQSVPVVSAALAVSVGGALLRRHLRGGRGDLAGADRRRPRRRPVDEQAVAERHPAEPQPLLGHGLRAHPSSSSARSR